MTEKEVPPRLHQESAYAAVIKIYMDNVDGHPSEEGYKYIAETLLPYVN